MAEKVKGTFRRVAVGLIKEYAPDFASKFILEAVRKNSFADIARFAEERRNIFLERWNSLSPTQRRKIRSFFSHVEREVRPVFGDAGLIRMWLGKEAKRRTAKKGKTRDDYAEVAYINFVLNSPQVFSWVCWLSKEAGDTIFGEEPTRPTSHVELEVEKAAEEKPEPELESEPEPEEPVPIGLIAGEEKG